MSDAAWQWKDMAPGYAQIYASSKRNAVVRGIDWRLSQEEFVSIVHRANDRCEITGLRFRWERWPGSERRPLIPSLDRTDSALGYSYRNCRMVAAGVNIALAEWGDDFFKLLADALVLKFGSRSMGFERPEVAEIAARSVAADEPSPSFLREPAKPQKKAPVVIKLGEGPLPKLRTRDAAKFLGLSVSYLEKLRVTGGGPRFYSVGRAVLYDTIELERWARVQEAGNTAEARARRRA